MSCSKGEWRFSYVRWCDTLRAEQQSGRTYPSSCCEPGLTLEVMPAENVEVIGRLIDAWNRRDLQAALEEMHPQCEVRPAEANADTPWPRRCGRRLPGLVRRI
jgi:hypothetical protein